MTEETVKKSKKCVLCGCTDHWIIGCAKHISKNVIAIKIIQTMINYLDLLFNRITVFLFLHQILNENLDNICIHF